MAEGSFKKIFDIHQSMAWYLPVTWFEDAGGYRRITAYTIRKTSNGAQKMYSAAAIFQNKLENEEYGLMTGNGRSRRRAVESCRRHAKDENGFPLVRTTMNVLPFLKINWFDFE